MTKENGAANKIAGLAARSLNLYEMKEFQTGYANIGKAYDKSSFALLSTINLKGLDEFQSWKPYLLDNKEKIMPLIISKMLNGDIMAFNIYKELTSSIIKYDMIHNNKSIAQELKNYGGAEDGLAIVNARHWLETKEAAEVFDHFADGKIVECEVNDMLGINNIFINCEHYF